MNPLTVSVRCGGRLGKSLLSTNALKHSNIQDKQLPLQSSPSLQKRSHKDQAFDHARTRIGKREIVGYGMNGSPIYIDLVEFPMPAIRFREPTPDIEKLRKREKNDWNNLSLDEKKKLYRYSFCQTFAEMTAPTGYWKMIVGMACWAVAFAFFTTIVFNLARAPLPESYKEDSRQQQLKRMIALQINPVHGISSKWDYEIGDWK